MANVQQDGVQQDGRVALVTGASRGIGAAVARLLASRGLPVVINYRSSRGEADEIVASITSAGGQALAVQADVRDEPAVLAMVKEVRAALGEVEVLVHNALIPYAVKSLDEITWDELGGKLDQEMHAAFVLTKAVIPGMTARGYRRIVYLGAEPARPRAGMIALGVSKAALGRIASPDDVARAVAFYAGDDSGFITGTTALVNGGLDMD